VRVKDDQSLYRVGGKLDIAPGQSIVLSSIYQTRDISLFTIDVGQGVTFDIWSSAMEAQYSLVEPGFNLIAGAGHLRGFLAQPETGFSVDSYFSNAYVYALVKPQNSGLKLSFGASMDTLDENALHRSELCPKLGLIWNPIASTTIRAASIKTLKRPLVGNQTIEPTQIAGFDQFFEDVDGAVSWLYGVGVDQRLGSIHVGLQASQRDIHVPLVLPDSTIDIYWKERAGTAYVYWPIASDRQRLLLPSWSFAALLGYEQEYYQRPADFSGNEGFVSLKSQLFPITLTAFPDSSISLRLGTSYVRQKGVLQVASFTTAFPVDRDFWITNFEASYLISARRGSVTVGVQNLFNRHFQFEETDVGVTRFSPGRFIFARLTIRF